MAKEQELLRGIIDILVDDSNAVEIQCTETEHTAVYDIKVSDGDVGKVLGKKGIHANALRTIFGAIYGKMGKKLHLQVVDPRKGR